MSAKITLKADGNGIRFFAVEGDSRIDISSCIRLQDMCIEISKLSPRMTLDLPIELYTEDN